jgi:hypothetical protein
MQPMGNEPMNALNTNVAQREETNEQHKNAAKLVVQKDPTVLLTTHQIISHTST